MLHGVASLKFIFPSKGECHGHYTEESMHLPRNSQMLVVQMHNTLPTSKLTLTHKICNLFILLLYPNISSIV
jgi:hypothetical protein